MRPLGMAACAAFLCAGLIGAQTPARKEPALYRGPVRPAAAPLAAPGLRLSLGRPAEFSLAPLSAAENARLAEPSAMLRLGITRPVPSEAITTGSWTTLADGSRIWRMALRSPGSIGIRVEFRDFNVGDGKVWLQDGASSVGPYSGRGLFGNGHFWSATVYAESIIIEYQVAPGAPNDTGVPFALAAISHRAATVPRGRRLPQATGPTVVDTADYCELDVSCYPDWSAAKSMVAQLMFVDSGSEYLCSGSAVATRDDSFKPYLLTAGHCIHSEDDARSLETYWTYQTSSCGAPPPASRDSSTKSSLGGHLIGSGTIPQGDYSLVLLPDMPAGVLFEGWDMADPAIGADLTGIHHPSGSWKRISFGNRVDDETVDVEGTIAPANLYLEVLWNQGRTEPGSSGSPLYSAPGVVVGTLTYGPYSPQLSPCEIDPSVSGYGRFTNTYANLKDYFENLPSAAVIPAQTDLHYTVINQNSPGAQTVILTTQSQGQISYKLRADAPWIHVSPATGTLSENSPATVQIAVDATQFDQPQQYSSTVTILSGAADPQYVNITADVTVIKSNIKVSISPNPVVQSGGQWQFAIQLNETGGAGTVVSGMKVNGVDYSAGIPAWFGSSHIDANGSITAPLTAVGPFVKGTQYFEFWGTDDGGGQNWYRVATVQFQ